jgi:NodT family efflux transporter outer membrane factor (OMF) lipoprotein
MSIIRTLIASASVLALVACSTVGPEAVAPIVPPTASGPFLSAGERGIDAASPATRDWWRLYRDPVLDRLIDDALAANTDVRVAVARLARARALLREVRAQRTPQVGVDAGAQYGRLPSGQGAPGGEGDRESLLVDVGVGISYEADLFGRVSRGVEAARGDVAGADADIAAVQVLVAAETARAYADAASAAERQTVAGRIVALLDRSILLTQRRYEVGLGNRLDVARIAALRQQRQAEVPALVAERQAALFRLAALTGRTPAELPPEAGARRVTLRIDQPIPVGDGAALLARRPDVRAAERRLAAATARIGVATADLYPRITLGGSFGSNGSGLGNLFGAGPLTWLLGPLLSWTANREPARARIAAAEADSQAALATFDGTVLRALEETETALSNYARLLDRRTALQAAFDEAQTAVRITRARQREGQINSLELLDAERTVADAEAAVADVDGAIAGAQVELFRALGGGWARQSGARLSSRAQPQR